MIYPFGISLGQGEGTKRNESSELAPREPTFAKAPVGKRSGIWQPRIILPNPASEPAYALRASARQAV